MKNGIANPMRHSKRGTTLIELVVSMILTAIFAVVCIALINPIERVYKQTEKISRAELLADTIVDSIRKECDEAKNDDINSVWIADGNINNDSSLFDENCALKKNEGHILVFKKNNSYCETIFSELKITEQNKTDANNNELEGTLSGHAVDELFEGNKENTEKGIVHFGYYQAGDKGNGVYPLKSYDYTNPVLASTYGDFYVKIYFKNLVTRELTIDSVTHTIPSFVECEVRVYEGDYISSDTEAAKNLVYTRTAALCFSANGSAPGSSYQKPDPIAQKKNIKVQVVWEDDNVTTYREDVTVTLLVGGSAVSSKLVRKTETKPFIFANVTIDGEITLGLTEVEQYTCSYKGNADDGYVVTYKLDRQKTVKLINGQEFIKKLGQDIDYVVFGKKSDYPEIAAGAGQKVAIPYTANWDNMTDLRDDYMLYKVTENGVKTAYILSKDGEFVFNENCKKMFVNCKNLKAITGITGPATNGVVFDTSITENMMSMFEGLPLITSFDMPDFVTGTCNTIEAMFKNCTGLTSFDFGNWDTSGITTTKNMFESCTALETVDGMYNRDFGSLTTWETMFKNCTKFHELDITGIQIPKITTKDSFNKVFVNGYITTLNMSGARVGLTSFDTLFNGNKQLETVDFSNVVASQKEVSGVEMFVGCSNLKSVKMDADAVNSYKLTNGYRMFKSCKKLEEISFKGMISNATENIEEIWYDCSALKELDFSGSDFTGLETMKDMCRGCTGLTSLDITTGVKTGDNAINCQSIVRKCNNLESFTAKNLHVSSLRQAFDECHNLSDLNLSNIDASECLYLISMFRQCYKLEEFDFNCFKRSGGVINMSKVLAIHQMFVECTSLKSIKNMTDIDFSSMADTFDYDTQGDVSSMLDTFKGCGQLKELDISGIRLPKITNKDSFHKLFSSASITKLNMSRAEMTGMSSFENMFNGKTIYTDIDFSDVKAGSASVSTKGMFQACTNLVNCKVNSTGADTFKTSTADQMFSGCSKLKTAEVDGLIAESCESLRQMFFNCKALESFTFTSDVQLTGVLTTEQMFDGAGIGTITLNGVQMPNCKNCSGMFQGCTKLETIAMDGFATPSCENMSAMFKNCVSATGLINLTGWDTSSVTNMQSMFENFASTYNTRTGTGDAYLDISSFDFTNVTNCSYMFNINKNTYKDYLKQVTLPVNCQATSLKTTNRMFRNRTSLGSIVNLDTFTTSGDLTDTLSMFADCRSMEVIDISSMNLSGVTVANYMFNTAKNYGGTLKTIYVSANPDYAFNPSKLTSGNSSAMFEYRTNLKGGKGTTFNSNIIDRTYARIDEGPTSAKPGYFSVK